MVTWLKSHYQIRYQHVFPIVFHSCHFGSSGFFELITFLIPRSQVNAEEIGKQISVTDIPGCENYREIMHTDPLSCCPSIPVVEKDKSAVQKCSTECFGKGKCCFVDCGLKAQNLADSSGKFVPVKAKELISSLTKEVSYVSTNEISSDSYLNPSLLSACW